MNSSLEFLNMIKNQSEKTGFNEPNVKRKNDEKLLSEETEIINSKSLIAVIDTETNWNDQVMSLGVAIADAFSFKLLGKRYYVFEPECYVGGIYSNVVYYGGVKGSKVTRAEALKDLKDFLTDRGIKRIFAYNAKFDYNHLPELQSFEWYDIMRIAAYRQFNSSIPPELPCCKTGRLKTGYGVEPIMHYLTGDKKYHEIHNAVYDAVDELKIIELLGHPVEMYECGLI